MEDYAAYRVLMIVRFREFVRSFRVVDVVSRLPSCRRCVVSPWPDLALHSTVACVLLTSRFSR
jgi:hypothetical protein